MVTPLPIESVPELQESCYGISFRHQFYDWNIWIKQWTLNTGRAAGKLLRYVSRMSCWINTVHANFQLSDWEYPPSTSRIYTCLIRQLSAAGIYEGHAFFNRHILCQKHKINWYSIKKVAMWLTLRQKNLIFSLEF